MRRRGPLASDLLIVCTGNICRSPYIHALLARRHPSLVVRSAGTQAMVGWSASPEVAVFLGDDSHIAQQLTRQLIEGAAVIITATASHRAQTLRLVPSAESRTFTLLELARLLGETAPAGGVEGMLAAAGVALAAQTKDFDDDLADPFQRGQAAYDAMAATVEPALAVIDPWLP